MINIKSRSTSGQNRDIFYSLCGGGQVQIVQPLPPKIAKSVAPKAYIYMYTAHVFWGHMSDLYEPDPKISTACLSGIMYVPTPVSYISHQLFSSLYMGFKRYFYAPPNPSTDLGEIKIEPRKCLLMPEILKNTLPRALLSFGYPAHSLCLSLSLPLPLIRLFITAPRAISSTSYKTKQNKKKKTDHVRHKYQCSIFKFGKVYNAINE